MTGDPHVVDASGKERFQSPAAEDVVVRATGEETNDQDDIVELTISPGPGRTPLHVHRDNDEAMHFLENEIVVILGDERHELAAGGYAMAPRGLPEHLLEGRRRPGGGVVRLHARRPLAVPT